MQLWMWTYTKFVVSTSPIAAYQPLHMIRFFWYLFLVLLLSRYFSSSALDLVIQNEFGVQQRLQQKFVWFWYACHIPYQPKSKSIIVVCQWVGSHLCVVLFFRSQNFIKFAAAAAVVDVFSMEITSADFSCMEVLSNSCNHLLKWKSIECMFIG